MIKKVDISVYGSDFDLISFLRFIKTVQECGEVGATRTLKLWVDGDGAGAIKFDFDHSDSIKASDLEGDLKFYIGD